MPTLRARHFLPVFFVLVAGSACAGRAVMPFVDSPLAPEEAASRRVERATDRAEATVQQLSELRLVARYNPAPCACPSWEVAVGSGWERVALRAARDADAGLDRVLEGQGIAESARLWIDVLRTSETIAGPAGRPYAVLEVRGIVADAGAP